MPCRPRQAMRVGRCSIIGAVACAWTEWIVGSVGAQCGVPRVRGWVRGRGSVRGLGFVMKPPVWPHTDFIPYG